jgi:membrane-bound lytic murein transglycosylase D
MRYLRLLILLIAVALAGCASNKYAQHKYPYVAADTSRTIDLTHPPRDMWDRIRRGFAIPNLHSDLVDKWTDYYASHPEMVERMSTRAGKYLYYIVNQINQRGLPTELALLPFVESAYKPYALSRSKASGLWQFIPSTGLHYNLQQTWWHDQRRDPVASTQAALDYLSYLYDLQGSWDLALASYNWGEGAVQRAMQKNEAQGLPTDYLDLDMPDETRNYVPKLQAIKNIIANPEKYGITLPYVSNTPYFKTVQKTRDSNMDIAVAASLAEMSVADFKSLNASFNRPVILGKNHPTLLLPANKVDIFNANLAAYTGKLSSWETYQARKGESLALIAKRHDISLAKLRQVNGISKRRRHTLARTLLVPATDSVGVHLASLNVPDDDVEQTRTERQGKRVVHHRVNVRIHRVRPGDTLYSLARHYHTSVKELKRLNNMKSNKLSIGKRLRVPGTHVRG